MLDYLTAKKLFFWRKSFLRRFCTVVLPGPALGMPSHEELGTVDAIEAYVGSLHPLLRLGMAGLFDLINFQAIFFGGFLPVTMLSARGIERYLHRLENSSFYFTRNLFTAAKAVAMLTYYADARIEQRMGYVDDCIAVKTGVGA